MHKWALTFPIFNMLDYCIILIETGQNENQKLLCSSPRKAPTAHHYTQCKQCLLQGRTWVHCRSSAPWQSPPAAHRSELWQHPNTKWMALLPHASELTLGRGSRRRTTIASGKQSFPSQTSLGTPYSPVMVWVEDFFPCTHRSLCSNKFGTFFSQSAPERCQEPAEQVGVFSSAPEEPELYRIRCSKNHQSQISVTRGK